MSLTSHQRDKLISDLKKKYDAEEGEGTLFTTTRILIENYMLFVRDALADLPLNANEIDIVMLKDEAVEHFFNYRKSLVGLDLDDNDKLLKEATLEDFRSMINQIFFWKYFIPHKENDLPCIILTTLFFDAAE